MTVPAVAGLPVDQHLGNLEGKEMRFGTSAGATYAAVTTDVTCGSINAEADSLHPMAGLSPMIGMWLNCVFGGKGVGMINMLIYVIIGIFVAGMMVGRTPEYLGKKIGAREVKLAIVTLLVHPFLILLPTGLFAATSWGLARREQSRLATVFRRCSTSSPRPRPITARPSTASASSTASPTTRAPRRPPSHGISRRAS